MTGRDLILYILENHLEDEKVFEDGRFIGFVSVEEAAAKLNLGVATVSTMVELYHVEHVTIDGVTYIPFNYSSMLPHIRM